MEQDLPRPFGPWVLLETLGRGATGDVFLARSADETLGLPAPLVIKRLLAELAGEGEVVRRFRHEAEIAVLIDSPHVARVYDAGSVGDTLYLALEYIEGWPLSRVIDECRSAGRPIPVATCVGLIGGALRGLEAMHGATDPRDGRPLGLIHRDLAPKNLMLGADGIVRVIDLGLGKSSMKDWKTRTGAVMGSLGYMAPEQTEGRAVDVRTDLYALGIVLFELLTLEPYIKQGPQRFMMIASLVPDRRPASTTRPDIPAALDAVIARALALDPSARYPSARAFLDALSAVVSEAVWGVPTEALIGDLLRSELEENRTRVAALVEREPEALDPRPEPTVVFARRPPAASPPISRQPIAPPGILGKRVPAPAVGVILALALAGGVLADRGLAYLEQGTVLPPLAAHGLTVVRSGSTYLITGAGGSSISISSEAEIVPLARGWLARSSGRGLPAVALIGTSSSGPARVRALSINDCPARALATPLGIALEYARRSIMLPEGGGPLRTVSVPRPSFAERLLLEPLGLVFGEGDAGPGTSRCTKGFGPEGVLLERMPPGEYRLQWSGGGRAEVENLTVSP